MANIYENFLRLVGFEEDEMSRYVPDWRKASEKFGLTEEDIKFATEEFIPANYDIELKGVRKLIGAYIKETIELAKSSEYKQKGAKIVYGILLAITHYYSALKLAAPDKIYVCFPDILLVTVLQCFFHKINPYLEGAEQAGIPYGCRHCALNKSRYIARKWGLIPPPDISWIWGFTCDEGPKTDEFIRIYCDPEWKTYISRLPHDQALGTVEDEIDERVEYLAAQMRDGFNYVQKEVGVKVSDKILKKTVDDYQRYLGKLDKLYQLMSSDPQPLSGQEGQFFAEALIRPFNIGQEPLEEALDIVLEEVNERVTNRRGILPSGSPKLMANFVPIYLPWVVKMFEQNRVGLTYLEGFMPSKKQLQPPRFEDPFMAVAETWLKQSYTVNPGYEAEMMVEKINARGVDGFVFGFFDFDRWLGSDHKLLSKMVREKSEVPVFYIEGDLFEDRDYSPEALRTRIESICEIVKMQKS